MSNKISCTSATDPNCIPCASNDDCKGNASGHTMCLNGLCQTPSVINNFLAMSTIVKASIIGGTLLGLLIIVLLIVYLLKKK